MGGIWRWVLAKVLLVRYRTRFACIIFSLSSSSASLPPVENNCWFRLVQMFRWESNHFGVRDSRLIVVDVVVVNDAVISSVVKIHPHTYTNSTPATGNPHAKGRIKYTLWFFANSDLLNGRKYFKSLNAHGATSPLRRAGFNANGTKKRKKNSNHFNFEWVWFPYHWHQFHSSFHSRLNCFLNHRRHWAVYGVSETVVHELVFEIPIIAKQQSGNEKW